MKRTLLRLGLGLALVSAIGVGLAWARPELKAALLRLGLADSKAATAMCPNGHDQPAETCTTCREHREKPDYVDDGWCLAQKERAGPDCQPSLPVVKLSSPETAKRVGLRVATTEVRKHVDTVVGNAEISYATHAYAEIRPRVSGRIAEIPAGIDEGVHVEKGQVVAIVDSAEVGTAKSTYLGLLPIAELASQTYERTASLARSDAVAQKDVLETKAALNKANADLLNARQRLLNLGYTDADLAEIARKKDTSSRLNIIAPMDGVLVERHAVAGESVEPNTQLFADTDIREMWAWIDVSEDDADRIKIGQRVTFRVAGRENVAYTGAVELVGFAVNQATRTVRVRAELKNTDFGLRSLQFGRAEIELDQPREIVVVSRDALQNDGKADLLFVPRDDQSYRPQRVLARPCEYPGMVEIAWGIKPGERVVTTGSFLLKSEMLKLSGASLGGE